MDEGRNTWKPRIPGGAPMLGSAEVPVTKAEHLYLIAQKIAEKTPGFFAPIGAGKGNLRSNTFMDALRITAKQVFGRDYSEAKLCSENKLAIDFYFPDEETAVEIAGMLGAPNSEYEIGTALTLWQNSGSAPGAGSRTF